jgi:hypothetical protein
LDAKGYWQSEDERLTDADGEEGPVLVFLASAGEGVVNEGGGDVVGG